MANKPKNHGKSWSAAEIAKLGALAQQNTPTRVIGLKLARTPAAIYAKAAEAKLGLKPVNQSPYNRRKKS